MKVENPEHTSVCLLVDKEEIGSVGASGMQSRFFENCDSRSDERLWEYTVNLQLRRAMQ